jgi:hypothetical protein
MLLEHIDKLLCLNKYLILKGTLAGGHTKFIEPQPNVSELYNFNDNPILGPYVGAITYVVISKFESITAPSDNPFYNIQIILTLTPNSNILEVGTGLLKNNVINFNLTGTSTLSGTIQYYCDKDVFYIDRFSSPPDIIFIDQGYFVPISVNQFEMETKIKVN